jgi:hypothetical protein
MSAPIQYFTGLDLGQAQDYTAVAVLEKRTTPDSGRPGRTVSHYAVRHLERFRLGMPYPDVCTRLARLFADPPLAGSTLVVDYTGVGRPVLDMLRRSNIQAGVRAITITGGQKATAGAGGWMVPKRELVSNLQVLLQARRIKVAPTLPAAALLVQELMNFQVKISPAAHETFGTWREGAHDDLVLATAIAAWLGELARRRVNVSW